ncbi:hypothetical protein [Polynucleobacter sp. AM-25C3]
MPPLSNGDLWRIRFSDLQTSNITFETTVAGGSSKHEDILRA